MNGGKGRELKQGALVWQLAADAKSKESSLRSSLNYIVAALDGWW